MSLPARIRSSTSSVSNPFGMLEEPPSARPSGGVGGGWKCALVAAGRVSAVGGVAVSLSPAPPLRRRRME